MINELNCTVTFMGLERLERVLRADMIRSLNRGGKPSMKGRIKIDKTPGMGTKINVPFEMAWR